MSERGPVEWDKHRELELELEQLRQFVTPEQLRQVRSETMRRQMLEWRSGGKTWQQVEAEWREEEAYQARRKRCAELEPLVVCTAGRGFLEEWHAWQELMALDPDYYRSGYLEWCASRGVKP